MKINSAYLFFAFSAVTVSQVQANEPEAAVKSRPHMSIPQTKPNASVQQTKPNASAPQTKPNVSGQQTKSIYVRPMDSKQITRKPVTVTQVERQTGGKVIGARSISVQGQQLNQIKVLMPNGRIIIHEQLFDENGRSVETVDVVEPTPEVQTK
jgi:hypothetical protein